MKTRVLYCKAHNDASCSVCSGSIECLLCGRWVDEIRHYGSTPFMYCVGCLADASTLIRAHLAGRAALGGK